MSTRMQQRRGTSSQWTSANPLLASGEIGFETNTGKFKIGDGTQYWNDLGYYASAAELQSIIAGAPAALDTLNELAAALGNDSSFSSHIITSLSGKLAQTGGTMSGNIAMSANKVTGLATPTDSGDAANKGYVDSGISTHNSSTTSVHGIADTSALATKGYADTQASTAQSAAISAASTALTTHNSATTSVHGISNTANLVYTSDSRLSDERTPSAGSVTAVKIASDAVTTVKILDANVTTGKIADSAVSTAKVADSAITTAKIADANITTAKIASGAVTKSMVGLGSVDNTADSAKPVSTAQQTALDAKLALAGGTMTGALTLSGAPTSDLHAATKGYVDGLAAGINFHAPVVAATAGNLAGTYNNGTSGVGATLTSASNASIGTIDGVSVSVGNRILLRAQTDTTQNGIYTITAVGSGSAPWQITRAIDADNNPSGELANGDFCFVTSGTTNAAKGFIVSTTGAITLGTTGITYSQFNASEAVIAGTNITKTGATIAVADAPTFSGAITASSGVTFSDGTQTKEGVISRTPIVQKTASYTLSALTERDSLVEISSASGVTLTVPTNATVAYPVGTSIDILQTGAGQITVAGASGVTVNATPGLKLRTQWSGATLFKRATDTWVLYGDLSA
jgi:hypothetical protein